MEVIEITEEKLESIRNSTEQLFNEYPNPVFIEYNNDNFILLLIRYGKYYNYFTHAEVFLPKELIINKLKIIKEYNESELTLSKLKNQSN